MNTFEAIFGQLLEQGKPYTDSCGRSGMAIDVGNVALANIDEILARLKFKAHIIGGITVAYRADTLSRIPTNPRIIETITFEAVDPSKRHKNELVSVVGADYFGYQWTGPRAWTPDGRSDVIAPRQIQRVIDFASEALDTR